MSEDKAVPWLNNQAVISQDELALIVVGSNGLCDKFGGQKLQLPVLHNGDPLIIQALMFNFGAKRFQCSKQRQKQFQEQIRR